MKNRRELEQKEHDAVWAKFYQLFHFNPSTTKFPGISTSLPHLKLSLKKGPSTDEEVNRFYELSYELFAKITDHGERLYGLDWQHECCDFNPRLSTKGELIPIYPDGDYSIVLTKDFNNVWFGHPWEDSITIVGDKLVRNTKEMLNEFEKIKMTVFNKI